MVQMNIKKIRLCFESLKIYRDLLKDPVLGKLYELIKYIDEGDRNIYHINNLYSDFYYNLMELNDGYSLKEYIIDKILFNENIFAKKSSNGFKSIPESLKNALTYDLDSLEIISKFTPQDIKDAFVNDKSIYNISSEIIENLVSLDIQSKNLKEIYERPILEKLLFTSPWSSLIDELSSFYKQNGWGIFAKYYGFSWDGENLRGINSLDTIRLSDLVNYERQKKIVVDNTLAFLNGQKVNNILLYGSRGTGKSSTVKALLNEFHDKGLRVIEVFKDHLHTFPKLISILKEVPLKFIIFVDDLSFEDIEDNYNKLKAVLEGSLETMPNNVVIYATSNRRHLIKEKFSERMNSFSDDEVHWQDTLEEKLSLADRFGIIVTYPSPTQQEYLAIVDELAKKRGIEITDNLHKMAIQWEMNYNGRSPRTAKQFIDWLVMNS